MGRSIRLSREEFQNGMIKLKECFSVNRENKTLARYWEYLHDKFTDISFRKAVEKIITEERFFPSIAVFMEKKQDSNIHNPKTIRDRQQEELKILGRIVTKDES